MGTKEKTAKDSKAKHDPMELKGLSPDDLADKILGIKAEPEFDDYEDPDAAKFWFEAAYGDELKGLFKEKNRMRVLVSALMRRGYDEEEIREIFIRVAKARHFTEKAMAEAEEKSKELSNKLTRLGVLLIGGFIVYQLLIKTNEAAIEKEKQRIQKIKTVAAETERPPFMMKNDLEANWNEVIVMKKNVTEKMNIRAERFPVVVKIAEGTTLSLRTNTELRIEEILLDSKKEKIETVNLEAKSGIVDWLLAESAGINYVFNTPSGKLRVKYGEGKIDLRQKPNRIAVREGETTFQDSAISLPMAVNGLMEIILTDPVQKRLYDNY